MLAEATVKELKELGWYPAYQLFNWQPKDDEQALSNFIKKLDNNTQHHTFIGYLISPNYEGYTLNTYLITSKKPFRKRKIIPADLTTKEMALFGSVMEELEKCRRTKNGIS